MSERFNIGKPESSITRVVIGGCLIFWGWTAWNWEPRPLPPGSLDGFQSQSSEALIPPNALIFHTVQPGDTLSTLAVRYGTTVDEIQGWNHFPDPDVIHPGWKIRVR